MSENVDEELARRLQEIADSVSGLSEDAALEVLEVRLKRAEAAGSALHRLSLARARGSLAAALGGGAEPEVLTSLRDMVATIERSSPSGAAPLTPLARVADPAASEYDPELAATLAELLEVHHENVLGIYSVIAKLSVAGDDPELLASLEQLVAYDLEGISELDPRD
jgi:hypothetical protein